MSNGTRIYNPNQTSYVKKETMRVKVKEKDEDGIEKNVVRSQSFLFFGGGRGTVISKNLKTTTAYGEVIESFTHDEVCDYFKKKGFVVEDSVEYTKRLNAEEKKAPAKKAPATGGDK